MLVEGKVALITGAARGLGKAFAHALLNKGAKVSVVDILEETGGSTVQEFQSTFGAERVIFIKCDVTDKKALEAAFAQTIGQLGGLDIVINNAAIIDTLQDDFQLTIDVNLTATIQGCYLAVDHMSKEKGGQGGVIINMCSMMGFNTKAGFPAYNASKYGVYAFTKSYAAMLNANSNACGVRLNMLCPTIVKTDQTVDIAVTIENNTCSRSLKDLVQHYGGFLSKEDLAMASLRLIEEDCHQGAALVVTSAGEEFVNPTKHWDD